VSARPSLRWVAFVWFLAGYGFASAFWRWIARIGDPLDWALTAAVLVSAVALTWLEPWAERCLRERLDRGSDRKERHDDA
jgi:hypothetical protein